jgi:hypothetical protein
MFRGTTTRRRWGYKRTVATTEQRCCQGTSRIRVVVSGDATDHSGQGQQKSRDVFRGHHQIQMVSGYMQLTSRNVSEPATRHRCFQRISFQKDVSCDHTKSNIYIYSIRSTNAHRLCKKQEIFISIPVGDNCFKHQNRTAFSQLESTDISLLFHGNQG